MNKKLDILEKQAQETLRAVLDDKELEEFRSKYLGRKGLLAALFTEFASLAEGERRKFGPRLNDLKRALAKAAKEKEASLREKGSGVFDPTIPGVRPRKGHLHLMTRAIEDVEDIFSRIGFYRVRHPEIDSDWYAFESLNMPADHPARDDWETFFVVTDDGKGKERVVLTPHTSNGQVREMEKGQLPIRIINIGKCYRRQADVSHMPMFHQFEGLYIDTHVTIAHLKGVIEYFVHQFYGRDRSYRLRPHNFRFTEPSFEIDITCDVCSGNGCRLCKEGWLELGGSGMVHPSVLKAGKIDPKKYSGFAFGWGVERCVMMKEGLNMDDIRLLYKNDVRVLQQF
jgi:phenylalanyl-tRNA synthetase alpha chain